MSDLCVSDVMTKDVIAVKENESLAEVYQLMGEHSFRHMPVVNDDKELVGIISERDLLRSCVNDESLMIAATDKGPYLGDHPVSEVMTTDPECIDEEAPLGEACQALLENKFDCLPVVTGKKLIGILTTVDILREVVRQEFEGD